MKDAIKMMESQMSKEAVRKAHLRAEHKILFISKNNKKAGKVLLKV